jgi:hypothetical protein
VDAYHIFFCPVFLPSHSIHRSTSSLSQSLCVVMLSFTSFSIAFIHLLCVILFPTLFYFNPFHRRLRRLLYCRLHRPLRLLLGNRFVCLLHQNLSFWQIWFLSLRSRLLLIFLSYTSFPTVAVPSCHVSTSSSLMHMCFHLGTDRVHVGDAEAGVDASAATDEDDARQAQAPVSRCTVGVSTPRLLPRRARPLHRVPCPFSQEANPHELTTTWVLSCLTYVQDDGGRSTHRHTL